ncbi:MAG: sulfatase-like hydrolase/transferase [Verrucomicrobiales bacterium]|nr:sulfatase-like hydrolase/transferase [Verrucomicrobiales bacterium]
MKSNRFFLFLLLFAVAAPLEGNDRPNIILLMGDDHGWEETGYNGHPDLRTPVLDEMAASGLRMDRFYAGHPSCSPTRGSVLTGRHPNRYGTFSPGFSLRPEEITIAHLLSASGYACGHFGKWHVGTVKAGSPTNPGAMGFDTWVSHDNFFELDPPLSTNGGPPEIHPGESSAVVIEETIQFIKRARADEKPFLAVVWFGSPHEPYSGLPGDLAIYDELPEKYADRKPVRLTSNETGRPVERPLGEVLRERYAEITAMDRSIGTLRDFLNTQNLRDDTLLWYCGDNGTPPSGVLASPLRAMKGEVYDGGIRVPGVIEWPSRIPRGRVSETNAVTSDILPTLCALTRTTLPNRTLDGISLAPLFDGYLTKRPQPIFFWSFDTRRNNLAERKPWIDPGLQEGTTPLVKLSGGIPTRNFKNFHHPGIEDDDYRGARVMLDNRYKLVVHDGKNEGSDPKRELFNLRADPGEKEDLSTVEPAVLEGMQKSLHDWQESVLESLTGADYEK